MKRLTAILAVIMLIISAAPALAEDIILPHPGYFFGKNYEDNIMWFDEYPEAEYEAYVGLLTGSYGMEISSATENAGFRECFLSLGDVEALVCCFQDDDGTCGLEVYFWGDVILSANEVYEAESNSAGSFLNGFFGEDGKTPEAAGADIAWAEGAMIADPGDFLGYEIAVVDILDMTDYDHGGNYFWTDYEEIDAADIWKYIDALDKSPYFERTGEYNARYASYTQIFFNYTGPDADLAASCEDYQSRGKRECDLLVQIHYPDSERSTFRIVTYPGFSVNSDTTNIPENSTGGGDGSLFDSCTACGGSGDCNYCWGRGYHWNDKNQDCSVCSGSGDCYSCGGSGRR